VEKRHVCRLAKPAQNGCGGWFWSLIAIEAGNELVMFRIEIGQSLNTRAWTTALFGSGVANAEAQVRHAPASASGRGVIRLMRDVSKAVKVGRLTTRCVTSSQRPGGLRRVDAAMFRQVRPGACPVWETPDPPRSEAHRAPKPGGGIGPPYRCR